MNRIVVYLVVLMAIAGPGTHAEPASPEGAGYRFTVDWFSHNIPHWSKILKPYMGKPNLRYLEIGVFEGRSVVWMVENVLTDPSSELVAIDIFADPEDLEERFRSNLKMSGFKGKTTVVRGRSQQALQALPLRSFDIVYVDGSHTLDDTFSDMILSWELLEDGGLLILDDYEWKYDIADDLRPKAAIDAFVNAFWKRIETVYKGNQDLIRKKPSRCDKTVKAWKCSPFGNYLYLWVPKVLFRGDDPTRQIELTQAEQGLIESIINARGFAEVELKVSSRVMRDPAFIRLKNRLELKLEGNTIVKYH